MDPDADGLLFYQRLEQEKKVFIVTRVSSKEGKSMTAYNLAITSSAAGKRTLLIEGDLRSASGGQYLNVPPVASASIDPLSYYGSQSDCITIVLDIANLYIITSLGPLRHVAAIMESNELERLFRNIRQLFDLVIVDTPPLEHCNDALLLESMSDGIILVTRPGFTNNNLLTEAINQMEEALAIGIYY